jgi:hypothetical protein
VATRGFFEDKALESRFLTEEMGQYRLRDDVPINLPSSWKEDALHIRNQLLLFRFRNLNKRKPTENLVDRSIEPRLNQIFVPLLSIIEDPEARRDLQELAKRYNKEMIADRGMDMEAQILEIIRDMLSSPYGEQRLPLKDITSWFVDRHGWITSVRSRASGSVRSCESGLISKLKRATVCTSYRYQNSQNWSDCMRSTASVRGRLMSVSQSRRRRLRSSGRHGGRWGL